MDNWVWRGFAEAIELFKEGGKAFKLFNLASLLFFILNVFIGYSMIHESNFTHLGKILTSLLFAIVISVISSLTSLFLVDTVVKRFTEKELNLNYISCFSLHKVETFFDSFIRLLLGNLVFYGIIFLIKTL